MPLPPQRVGGTVLGDSGGWTSLSCVTNRLAPLHAVITWTLLDSVLIAMVCKTTQACNDLPVDIHKLVTLMFPQFIALIHKSCIECIRLSHTDYFSVVQHINFYFILQSLHRFFPLGYGHSIQVTKF